VKILYCSDNSSDHNLRFLHKISSAGHEVVFCDLSGGDQGKGWPPPGLHYRLDRITLRSNADGANEGRLLSDFRTLLGEVQPDIVHAGPVQNCGYLAALAGFHPLIVMSWGSDLLHPHSGAEWKSATQIALEGADGFVCDCDAVLNAARAYVPLPDWRVAQFPWGITSGVFSPTGPVPSNDAMPFGPDTIRLICTRSWEPLYRIDLLLEALLEAWKQERRLRLILLGDGSERGRIHDFIAQNQLGDIVLAPGKLDRADLPAWFRAATAYVSCAESDGTSVSMLEAMATGLPVIVTDIASNREWVKPDENGWLARDTEAFTKKMLLVCKLTHAEREAIAARNRFVVGSRAEWDKNSDRLLELYERILCNQGAMSA
jgi:glycosyltransferase involved in cell wall biosynthesis